MITVRELKLTIINNDNELRKQQYKFIRDSQYAQYQGLNIATSYLGALYLEYRDFNNEEYKQRVSSFKFNLSNPKFEGVNFGKGIDTLSLISQKVKNTFKKTPLKEMARGERTLPHYKRNSALMTRGKHLKFAYNENNDIVIKWVNKIMFKVILGSRRDKSEELQHTLHKVINGEYRITDGSTFNFDKNNNLILKLSLDIPVKPKSEIVEGRILGVDLGIKIPAYVCLNDKEYIGKGIGSIEDLMKVRKQFNCRRERLQRQLSLTKGGHGRKDKLKALNSFTEKEKNYVKTYNHLVSKQIIEFAKKNNVGQINMEFLALADAEKETITSTVRWWSYYQLQQMIEYKAERENIVIKYVDPYRTSQTCSKCGHWEEGQRNTQAEFKCKSKTCGYEENADRNAARNIAKSKKYITTKEESEFFKNKEEIN